MIGLQDGDEVKPPSPSLNSTTGNNKAKGIQVIIINQLNPFVSLSLFNE